MAIADIQGYVKRNNSGFSVRPKIQIYAVAESKHLSYARSFTVGG